MCKKILITGKNSYIGTNLAAYFQTCRTAQGEPAYQVGMVSVRDGAWQRTPFAGYDTVFHMAGIAHADIGHATEEEKQRYYDVNCELAVKMAEKARLEGVKQFIYMSSVIVYGDSAPVGGQKHITADTPPAPANFYGDSKYQAEQKLKKLETDKFRVAIVRAPMVYGRDSKGNYRMLEKLAEKLPLFPSLQNQRSMIYIENLTEFLRLLADSGQGGVFWPQNAEYVSTAKMVQMIAEQKQLVKSGAGDGKKKSSGGKVRLVGFLNPFVRLASHIPGKTGRLADKAFGSLTVDQKLSTRNISGYQKYDLQESIRRICRE